MEESGAGQTLPENDASTECALPSLSKRKSKVLFYVPLFTAAVTMIVLVLAIGGGWLGKHAHIGSGFGEISRAGFIKQPVNTLTSFGFVIAGIVMGWCNMRLSAVRGPNPFTRQTFFAALFPSLVVCLGPGSMAMHATETRWGERLDMLAMYFFAGFLTAYAFARFFRLSRAWFVVLFAGVVLVCDYADGLHYSIPFIRDLGDLLFGMCVLVAVIIEGLNLTVRRANHDLKWGTLTLGFLLLAFLVWKLSLNCRPSYAVVQGHGIWHLLCAVAAFCLFRYYASEKPLGGSLYPAQRLITMQIKRGDAG